jgi:hypothetical protein
MARLTPPRRSHKWLKLGALVTTLAVTAAPVQARVTVPPEVQIGSEPMMSIDGRHVGVTVLARCPARSTVTEARVTVSQGAVSGSAGFPLTCTSGWQSFRVAASASSGVFQLGSVRLDAVVRIARGKTASASVSETTGLIPEVLLDAASTARLESGGRAVLIDVTTGCPSGVTPLDGSVAVEQGGRSMASARFDFVCDGSTHVTTLRAETGGNPFQLGPATVTAFSTVEYQGQGFYGVDSSAIEIVSP